MSKFFNALILVFAAAFGAFAGKEVESFTIPLSSSLGGTSSTGTVSGVSGQIAYWNSGVLTFLSTSGVEPGSQAPSGMYLHMLSTGVPEWTSPPGSSVFYGDSIDSATTVTWDGSTTVAGIVPSGSVYTLTKDVYVKNGIVNIGTTIKTNGYRLCAKGYLAVNGTIHNNGNDASGVTAGTIGTAGSTQITGTAGTAGSSTTSATTANKTNSYGGGGGKGGTGASGSGGAPGTTTVPPATAASFHSGGPWPGVFLITTTSATTYAVPEVGVGGTGGGGGGGTGGGGGAGGGSCEVYAKWLKLGSFGKIQANGGTGGIAPGTNGGGGGGGGGGWVVIVTDTLTNSGTIQAVGGAGGAGKGTGAVGATGSDGTVFTLLNNQ